MATPFGAHPDPRDLREDTPPGLTGLRRRGTGLGAEAALLPSRLRGGWPGALVEVLFRDDLRESQVRE